ncbi:MAG: proline--tRNA ligase [Chloroflexi bacterium]|jgi:prolyl-tRNA synthetase|nr:proline--tRNA ligase [Chloroflexota bacterium]
MRMSHLFGRTLRDAPSDAQLPSHQLSVRAGLVRQLAQGIYSFLPLGWRAIRKIEGIIRQEMDAVGGQELLMPLVHPAELWQRTGRYDAPAPGRNLLRFNDRWDHPMVLAMTHEEVAADLARTEISSYRQLPLMTYHFQVKFRDEPRARGGLVRVREFIMKDAYTYSASDEQLDEQYQAIYAAYLRIFQRCGLDVLPVRAATGAMGGSASHEFMVPNELGEDTLLLCPACGYAANAETATFTKGQAAEEPLAAMEQVATPGATTIEAVARYLGVPVNKTAKAVFLATPAGRVVFCVIRGDLEVSEAKVSALLGGEELGAATPEQLQRAGLVAGYASPVGVKEGAAGEAVLVIGDDSLLHAPNLVAGANRPGYHLVNVNYPRDYAVDQMSDIALAREGDPCPVCQQPLQLTRGIEVGHVFKLGTRYSDALGATYLDADGRPHPVIMGSYGIGLGRLLACIIEQHHDEHGIVWPTSVAPYQVYIASLARPGSEVEQAADALYERLCAAGFEVLYDDRNERAGVKFNDADLLGIPVRLTVSDRTAPQHTVECKLRWESERHLVPLDEVESVIGAAMNLQQPQA